MQDEQPLTTQQQNIHESVQQFYREHDNLKSNTIVTGADIKDMIKRLRTGCSPGPDGIVTEHLVHCLSDVVADHMAKLFAIMFVWCQVPSIIATGTVVPILKKPTLDPNNPGNYRPITLSSTYAKLVECFMTQEYELCDTQFGFRKGRGTALACSLLNNGITSYVDSGSPVFVCGLDAEKCFDSIWHAGLFHKLLRGSMLSPVYFNIFINDLLMLLQNSQHGIHIGDEKLNNVTYADDITLISATVTGLQSLVDICSDYADRWRFRFGLKKSRCLSVGDTRMLEEPQWFLSGDKMANVTELNILGCHFNTKNNTTTHIDTRIKACRRAMYSLREIGMCYPGLSTEVKAHLWRSVCVPSLTYGLECFSLTANDIKKLESAQGCLIKQVMGIGKRYHHTPLLKSMRIPSIEDIIKNNTAGLLNRAIRVASPLQTTCLHDLVTYVTTGKSSHKTLVGRICAMGLSPTEVAFNDNHSSHITHFVEDGLVDTLRHLTMHEQFIKFYSSEHVLTALLLRCF